MRLRRRYALLAPPLLLLGLGVSAPQAAAEVTAHGIDAQGTARFPTPGPRLKPDQPRKCGMTCSPKLRMGSSCAH